MNEQKNGISAAKAEHQVFGNERSTLAQDARNGLSWPEGDGTDPKGLCPLGDKWSPYGHREQGFEPRRPSCAKRRRTSLSKVPGEETGTKRVFRQDVGTGRHQYEEQLALDVGSFTLDPLGFVLYAFPWGEGGLEGMRGPEEWQREELEEIGLALRKAVSQAGWLDSLTDGVRRGSALERQGRAKVASATGAQVPPGGAEEIAKAVRRAIASGHGIGKSAFVAWIILWALSTCKDTRGVVTANTEAQLKGKTWAELAKWHRLCLCGHWFDCTATALISRLPGHEKTWRCDMVPWSERNTEAFAGLHNKGRRVLLVFDEASAIPDSIWDVSEGALTDDNTEIVWIVCGNPTRNTGRFRECFGRLRHRWHNRQVDSRTVSITNKAQLQEWIDDYGEDSDFVRVRVRGVFPRAGACQLIPSDLVDAAYAKPQRPEIYGHAPKVVGVDVARFGEDQSSIALRQGLACLKLKKFRGLDLMTFAGLVAQFIAEEEPDMTFVDQGGLGAGVVDRLRQLGIRNVIGVDFGGSPLNKEIYINKRTEMWCLMRDWLKEGGAIPPDEELRSDLISPEYGYTGDKGQIALEKKADMKKRGLASPDCGDSLALTFAAPVRPGRKREGGLDELGARKKRATQRSTLY